MVSEIEGFKTFLELSPRKIVLKLRAKAELFQEKHLFRVYF